MFVAWGDVDRLVAIKEQSVAAAAPLTEMAVMQMVSNHPRPVRLLDFFVTGQASMTVLEYLPSFRAFVASSIWISATGRIATNAQTTPSPMAGITLPMLFGCLLRTWTALPARAATRA